LCIAARRAPLNRRIFLNGSVAVPPRYFVFSLSLPSSLSLSLSLFSSFSPSIMLSIFLAGRLSLYLSVSDISLWKKKMKYLDKKIQVATRIEPLTFP
jgi:hypothetical protein